MRVAITFRDQPKREGRGNEYCHSSLSRRETESLPNFIELETPAFFSHKVTSASNRNRSADFSACSYRRQGCLFDEKAATPVIRPIGRGETLP